MIVMIIPFLVVLAFIIPVALTGVALKFVSDQFFSDAKERLYYALIITMAVLFMVFCFYSLATGKGPLGKLVYSIVNEANAGDESAEENIVVAKTIPATKEITTDRASLSSEDLRNWLAVSFAGLGSLTAVAAFIFSIHKWRKNKKQEDDKEMA